MDLTKFNNIPPEGLAALELIDRIPVEARIGVLLKLSAKAMPAGAGVVFGAMQVVAQVHDGKGDGVLYIAKGVDKDGDEGFIVGGTTTGMEPELADVIGVIGAAIREEYDKVGPMGAVEANGTLRNARR
jgi:hypothetical protein